jgi:hypothetical protein
MATQSVCDDAVLVILFIIIIMAVAAIIYLIRERLKDGDKTKDIF